MQRVVGSQIKEALDRGEHFRLIDVMDRDKFEKGHIPGSDNLPLKDLDFQQKADQLIADKNAKIVTYCGGPECEASRKAAQQLEDAGFTNVYTYDGGMKQWEAAHYPVEHSAGFELSPSFDKETDK